jgi:hypothetical protein
MRGNQATWHELIALTEQMRGFVDFAIHGISHRESGNREVVAMVFRLRLARNELRRTCPLRNSDQLFSPRQTADSFSPPNLPMPGRYKITQPVKAAAFDRSCAGIAR